ncbi:MAG: type II toxin-antitoxin system VapC family toxin [Gemmatimonadetes bacterium]|nr:type II toxin-antitoxin system VapC family toxin [Gemmatimonadota bacterium]
MASRKRRRGAAAPVAAPATWYIESSALLAAFLEADADAQQAIRARGRRMTSGLTLAEAHRAVLRARLTGRLTADQERSAVRGLRTFARRCELVAVSDDVLARAGRPFPVEPIRTLDAIHLASVELLGEPPQLVTVVTRDDRVADNARALGHAVA